MKLTSLFLVLTFLFLSSPVAAKDEVPPEKKPIRVVVKDAAGEKTEGYMFIYPEEVAVSTKDQQEKSIPLMAIQSIKVEKVPRGIPGNGQFTGEEYYSVRLENSQEILTLEKKYTLSLTTSVGVVTKTLDPTLLSKDSPSSTNPQADKPFIRDKSLIFSLELKF
jgi:hypothetical protein